jgi:hypothetical protein
MDVNKAGYWIALGVFALALSSEYRQGNFVTLHQVASRAEAALSRISTRAEQTLAVARVLTNGLTHGDKSAVNNLLASTDADEMARAQRQLFREQARGKTEFLRDQIREQIRARAEVIRAQAETERAEIEQLRLRTRSQFRVTRMITRPVMMTCPKTGARIAVHAPLESSDIDIAVPDIEVEVADSN